MTCIFGVTEIGIWSIFIAGVGLIMFTSGYNFALRRNEHRFISEEDDFRDYEID
jgi:hypothetical protein